VKEYMDNHPGGRHTLEHNIGRDISKFFYGGYGLDGNAVRGGTKRHTHSNIARAVAEGLAIARLLTDENDAT
jgi:cytochrome b involved in lipid metabolism